MAQVNIGACRVKTELYPELTFLFGRFVKLFS
jgi:hypothetical protein